MVKATTNLRAVNGLLTTPTGTFERSLARLPSNGDRYLLRLYVTGMTERSMEAFDAIKSVCEEHLADRYDLEVVDIYQQPALAKHEQVIAAPTLVKKQPLPLRRLIGDLADKERLLFGLDLSRKI